ncbi:MAG: PRC-barrel domain-containing protein [Candidatus Marsarchaeota archaeon]|nr:PRC-barrel domain-containing protein [Candidatus Marsarchaeota archaeon]
MPLMLSDLYGKRIITTTGKLVGTVEDIILDFESGSVSSLLLTKVDSLIRSQNTASLLTKNTVKYSRVRNVSESIIISGA